MSDDTDLDAASECALANMAQVRPVLDKIADKWTILIFLALAQGELRFNELRRRLNNISQKMLTQTLRALESDGFVDRRVIPTVPVTVIYSLTPLGESLLTVVEQLRVWAEANARRLKTLPARSRTLAQ